MDVRLKRKLHYVLIIAVAMCFIGHGAFGIITKPIWCNYFAVFGIGQDRAYQLMPIVGCIDIALGLSMLIYPTRIVPAWLIVWGIMTALLRPFSGEPFPEFIERAGNFGAPLALLILSGIPRERTDWLTKIDPNMPLTPERRHAVFTCLQIVAFFLLLGHGWLNLLQKASLLRQYTSLGASDATSVALWIGIMEIIAAFTILIKPLRPLLLVFLVWKMGSELFYPKYEIFEWIERAGSYASLLCLWLMSARQGATGLHFNLYKSPAQASRP